ncbi:desmin-like [Poecilia latipinna]|uniref:desmin-like n=1 Tax=Poecilia latipinna TaxID=48699 RepID=UPI00072E80C3|nr:PREDICTED: desmin-like [Poecilia latipinna]
MDAPTMQQVDSSAKVDQQQTTETLTMSISKHEPWANLNTDLLRMCHLNDRFAKYINICSLPVNEELMVENKVIEAYQGNATVIRTDTTRISEENVSLKSKVKMLDEQIIEITRRWKKEKELREEADKNYLAFIQKNKAIYSQVLELQKQIELLQEEKKDLEIKSEQGVRISMETIKYTGGCGNGDMVDGVKIDLSEIREYVSSFIEKSVTSIEVEYKSKITEWEIKVKEKDAELTEATTKIKNLSLQLQKYICEIKFLEEENTQIKKTEELKEHQFEKHLKEKEEEIEIHIKNYSLLYSESLKMHAEILMYKKLLEVMGSRINICDKGQSIFTSAGKYLSKNNTVLCQTSPLAAKTSCYPGVHVSDIDINFPLLV